MTKKTWIFDMDDTLIYNTYLYRKPPVDIMDYILRTVYKESSPIVRYLNFLIRAMDKHALPIETYLDNLEKARKGLYGEKHNKALTKAMNNMTKNYFKSIGKKLSKEEKNELNIISGLLPKYFRERILDKLEETVINDYYNLRNKENVKVFAERGNGYSVERVPTTMYETFEHFANQRGIMIQRIARVHTNEMGSQFQNVKYDLMKNVEEVLDFLKKKGDIIKIYTKGDRPLQERKILVNGLEKWFSEENINIVSEKEDAFPEYLYEGTAKQNVFVVGNNKGSDIVSPVNAGLNAIYIPFETWSYEKSKDRKNGHLKDYIQKKDIIQIKKQYNKITK